MDTFLKLLPALMKGISAATVLAQTDPAPAYRALKVLLRKAEAGTVTEDDIAKTSADLDALMDRFNRPI
jgi:hypothetical protein